jgi:hypothetical protein
LARSVPLLSIPVEIEYRMGGISMRFWTALSLASMFVVCLTAASWATPIPVRLVPATLSPSPDNQSQSGKIASIGDATFSLEVVNGQDQKTIQFFIDDDTKVEGKLQVGSQATVEYRSADGKNVAIHVVVGRAAA